MGLLSGLALGCGQIAGGTYEAELAAHLDSRGAKMYGAYWCPYGKVQNKLFKRAASQIPYVECDPQGAGAQAELCQMSGIRSYPTWEIEGEFYEGVQPLGKLARLTGFKAPPKQFTLN
ncbi:MAG: hypothetical protein F6J97_19030 [Leptolyngbya sp. SIO4C1]|nr:hypothetical protein [Leptolyngbya sp. SIO4C1]